MNFIRLWSLPPGVDNTKCGLAQQWLLKAILEVVMCRAFQNLPSALVLELFGDTSKYTNVGLNEFPLLLKGAEVSVLNQRLYTKSLTKSNDPQVRQWFMARERYRSIVMQHTCKLGRCVQPLLDPSYYQTAYRNVISNSVRLCYFKPFNGAKGFALQQVDMDFLVGLVSTDLQAKDAEPRQIARPFGTLQARIGLVLEWCPVDKNANCQLLEQGITAIPPILRDCGFNQSNSLIWTYDLRQSHLSEIGRPNPYSKSELDILCRFHRSLIQMFNLRVIILCGSGTERMIVSHETRRNRVDIELQGCVYTTYCEVDRNEITRLYMILPVSLSSLRYTKWTDCLKLGELIRFAATMTETQRIKGYYQANYRIYRHIIMQYTNELNGKYDLITKDTISPLILDWLSLKGVVYRDISKIERLGGTLSRGILLILMVLPREGPKQSSNPTSPGNLVAEQSYFPREDLGNTCDLYRAISISQYDDRDQPCVAKVQVICENC
ncbi:hypothetical protein BDV26DRAFT_287123 [Aspergillus bertholletiae]|uniref:Uncharacterized protein n=1 Tax=Aspergillus bertholletiae TaxID=1226010 RepID=A0A5N7BPE1_9EURO|nr:hypothetical protein BDV26DRAFT_287123 [Aspergillus bertholletiae]